MENEVSRICRQPDCHMAGRPQSIDEFQIEYRIGLPPYRRHTCKTRRRNQVAKYWRETYYPAHRKEHIRNVTARRRRCRRIIPANNRLLANNPDE